METFDIFVLHKKEKVLFCNNMLMIYITFLGEQSHNYTCVNCVISWMNNYEND